MAVTSASHDDPADTPSAVPAIFIEDRLTGIPESWVVMVAEQPLAGQAITRAGLPSFAGTHYTGVDPSQPAAAQRAIAENLRRGARIVFFGVSRDVQIQMVLDQSPRPDLYAQYGQADLWALLAPQIQALQDTPYPQLRQQISAAAARVVQRHETG